MGGNASWCLRMMPTSSSRSCRLTETPPMCSMVSMSPVKRTDFLGDFGMPKTSTSWRLPKLYLPRIVSSGLAKPNTWRPRPETERSVSSSWSLARLPRDWMAMSVGASLCLVSTSSTKNTSSRSTIGRCMTRPM